MKTIIIAAMLLCSTVAVNAQDFTKNGKTYEAAHKVAASVEKSTGFTWKDSKGNEYPIFMGKTGSCYIKKVSQKTGKEYKQYLGEEISRDICKQLNVEYTGKTK